MTTSLPAPPRVSQAFPRPAASPIDPSLKLRTVVQSLPGEVFEKDTGKALAMVATTLVSVTLSYALLAICPWYLLPIAWFVTGTALTGFFVIGHDCGHRSFFNNTTLNNWVGHIAFLPLVYPFHAWRILHNHHHKHTNKLEEDNAWTPMLPEVYDATPKGLQWGYHQVRGWFWWIGSVGHQLSRHFNWAQFEGKQRQQVRFSALLVLVTAAIAFPLMFATLGVWGLVKFWLMPWLGYHFWMSTFTIVHHTAPDIPFRPAAEWNEAESQLSGTVHCKYPAWIEFLCHDINVHIPHHVSTGIPSYRLRQAHASLQENWGDYLIEREFNFAMMKEIAERCHLYHPENYYESIPAHERKAAALD
ncbi:MAG: fatty acid desaturase [Synechococcales cyanobacterium RM1_1_8]|nr:fatty acid desaturase [Synechococcales cyanobacterium RM1_1_8]